MSSNTDNFNEIISKILLVDQEKVSIGFTMKENEDWDSMTHLMLISEIENTFDIVFSDDEVLEMTSIVEIKSILKKHSVTVD